MGWPATVAAVLYVTVVGGLVSIVAAAVNGNLVKLFQNIYWFFVGLILPGGKAETALSESAAPPIPCSSSVSSGTRGSGTGC